MTSKEKLEMLLQHWKHHYQDKHEPNENDHYKSYVMGSIDATIVALKILENPEYDYKEYRSKFIK